MRAATVLKVAIVPILLLMATMFTLVVDEAGVPRYAPLSAAFAETDTNYFADSLDIYILEGDTLPFKIIEGDTLPFQIIQGDTIPYNITNITTHQHFVNYVNYGLGSGLVANFNRYYNTAKDTLYTLAATDTAYVTIDIRSFLNESTIASSADADSMHLYVYPYSAAGDVYLDVAYDYRLMAHSSVSWGAPGSATELEDSLTTESTITHYAVPIDTLVQEMRLVITALDSCANYTTVKVWAAAWKRSENAVLQGSCYKYEEGTPTLVWNNGEHVSW